MNPDIVVYIITHCVHSDTYTCNSNCSSFNPLLFSLSPSSLFNCFQSCLSRCICMYVRMCVCMYVHTYECMYVCMYVCVYVCMYIRMNVCMYVCMYVCTRRVYISFVGGSAGQVEDFKGPAKPHGYGRLMSNGGFEMTGYFVNGKACGMWHGAPTTVHLCIYLHICSGIFKWRSGVQQYVCVFFLYLCFFLCLYCVCVCVRVCVCV